MTLNLGGVQLPESKLHISSKGTTSDIDSELYVTKNEKIELDGLFNYSKINENYLDLISAFEHIQFESTNGKVINAQKSNNVMKKSIIKDFEYRLSYQGLSLDGYLKYANTTLDDLRKSRIEDAKKTVKTRLVLEKIMVKEKLDITDEDIVNKFSEHAPDKKTVTIEDVRKTMGEEQFNYFANSLLLNKLMTFLKSKNKLD